jgi:hypothetical protein
MSLPTPQGFHLSCPLSQTWAPKSHAKGKLQEPTGFLHLGFPGQQKAIITQGARLQAGPELGQKQKNFKLAQVQWKQLRESKVGSFGQISRARLANAV